MTVISGIIKRFQRLNPNALVRAVIVPELNFIEQLQRQQLLAGTDSRGSKITPEYKESTRRKKIRQGKDPNKVTLKDTGRFHRAIRAEQRGNSIAITSTDSKTGELTTKYGDQIFGLNEENLDQVRRLVAQPLIERIRKSLLS